MRTRITNVSGAERHLGFVPPHGVTLASGEDAVTDGDLRTVLASGRGRYSRSREIEALDAEIAAGNVQLETVADPSSSSSSS